MEALAFINQKGGAAKTTTTVNFAAELGKAGKRCLVIDLDPQASLTTNLRISTRWNLFARGIMAVDTQIPNVWLVPGGPELVQSEMRFTVESRYDVLRPLLAEVAEYDYVLIDCPPNLYGSTANALVAADRIILPFPLAGDVVMSLSATMDLIRSLRDQGYAVTDRIDGLVTIYRKSPTAEKFLPIAQKWVPNVLSSRIRQSNHYLRAPVLGVAAAMLGTNRSYPSLDHRAALQEMRLL